MGCFLLFFSECFKQDKKNHPFLELSGQLSFESSFFFFLIVRRARTKRTRQMDQKRDQEVSHVQVMEIPAWNRQKTKVLQLCRKTRRFRAFHILKSTRTTFVERPYALGVSIPQHPSITCWWHGL
jgi:hypothetical protein